MLKSTITKVLYITLGFLFLGLGTLGILLPILPTTPFLLLASFFFAKGSERFHQWFISTKIYKNHLEEFIRTRTMTLKRKLCVLLPVSTMLITTFILVWNIYARISIILMIIFKYYYFFAHIKTIKKVANKTDKEKKIVKLMISIYCKGHKHLCLQGEFCQSCNDLIEYVDKRIERCPFIETKSYCSNCTVHCYKKDMRIKIKEVMKYSGPRMIFIHPLMVVDHAYQGILHRLKNNMKSEKERGIYDK